MTKYAIISDIHANYDALQLVMKDAEKRNVDKIICLGDLVNKYFQPAQVIDAIKSDAEVVLKGNHEEYVVNDARFKWVRGQIGKRIEYLADLPLRHQLMINKVLINLYHATPDNLSAMFNPTFKQDTYLGGMVDDHKDMFIGDQPQIVLYGHTHKDYIGVEKKDGIEVQKESSIIVGPNDRALINVGSVGENNGLAYLPDGTIKRMIEPYVTYAIIDDSVGVDKVKVEIIHVPYVETLKSIYFQRLAMHDAKTAPDSPNDDKTIAESLMRMGIPEEELRRR